MFFRFFQLGTYKNKRKRVWYVFPLLSKHRRPHLTIYRSYVHLFSLSLKEMFLLRKNEEPLRTQRLDNHFLGRSLLMNPLPTKVVTVPSSSNFKVFKVPQTVTATPNKVDPIAMPFLTFRSFLSSSIC